MVLLLATAGGVEGVEGAASTSPVVEVPAVPSRITAPPSLKRGPVLIVVGDCVDDLEARVLFLRSRKTRGPGVLRTPLPWLGEGTLSSVPGEVNARDNVLGRKKPSLPKGMLRP
jgi:hypothetical protein